MTELETLLMKFVGRLLHMQLEFSSQQPSSEYLQKRQKDVTMLVEELVSKFYWVYKFKDEKTQTVIRQQARLLHNNDVDTVVSDVAVLALHHLLFKVPDDQYNKMKHEKGYHQKEQTDAKV